MYLVPNQPKCQSEKKCFLDQYSCGCTKKYAKIWHDKHSLNVVHGGKNSENSIRLLSKVTSDWSRPAVDHLVRPPIITSLTPTLFLSSASTVNFFFCKTMYTLQCTHSKRQKNKSNTNPPFIMLHLANKRQRFDTGWAACTGTFTTDWYCWV